MHFVEKMPPPKSVILNHFYPDSTTASGLNWIAVATLLPTELMNAEREALLASEGLSEEERHLRIARSRTRAARARFDSVNVDVTCSQLLSEQHHLCCFCEGKIEYPVTTGKPQRKVRRAHWEPLSLCPSLALTWTNVYASCSGTAHCDVLQGDRSLGVPPLNLWPPVSFISCRTSGFLVATDEGNRLYGESILNLLGPITRQPSPSTTIHLNHPDLVIARKSAIDGARDLLTRKLRHVTKEERLKILAEMISSRKRVPYFTAWSAWLRGQLVRT